MNVLVVGSGAREHALAWALRRSPSVRTLLAAPGNPGMASLAECVPVKAGDLDGLLALARERKVDLTVVGPEQPLAAGIADRCAEAGLAVFGPTRAAAELEWSKAFAKEFMLRHGIPTAGSRTFRSAERNAAEAHLAACPLPVVLKADGLAAGKGVLICQTRADAAAALGALMDRREFGGAGECVVVEEYMEGEEASLFAITDGERYVCLAGAQDHKRVSDGDRGKNTGGMGAYAPAPVLTPAILAEVRTRIVEPTIRGMAAEGRPYRGCLYVGLMMTASGPNVVEYNCRFGDPETQVVVPLYTGDFFDLLWNAARGSLDPSSVPPPGRGTAVCVVLASGGYPDTYRTGFPIEGLEVLEGMPGVAAFHAGTADDGGRVVTAGGRVLGITAVDDGGDLAEAIARAYGAVQMVGFEGMHFRTDIGRKGMAWLARQSTHRRGEGQS
jgi:phosphoribosylamine--glycine ligase